MKALWLFSLTFHSSRRAKSIINLFSQLKGNFKQFQLGFHFHGFFLFFPFLLLFFGVGLPPTNSNKNMICPNIRPEIAVTFQRHWRNSSLSLIITCLRILIPSNYRVVFRAEGYWNVLKLEMYGLLFLNTLQCWPECYNHFQSYFMPIRSHWHRSNFRPLGLLVLLLALSKVMEWDSSVNYQPVSNSPGEVFMNMSEFFL